MDNIGWIVVLIAMGTMVKDGRYKSGVRGNTKWEGWRVYLLGFGVTLIALGWLFNAILLPAKQTRVEMTARPSAKPTAPTPVAVLPPKLALAGIELGADVASLERRGASCGQDVDAEDPSAIVCELTATFGGMQGPLRANVDDGRITFVYANDNLDEQLVGLRREWVAAYGNPTPIEGGGERWAREGQVLELKAFSAVLYRPQ